MTTGMAASKAKGRRMTESRDFKHRFFKISAVRAYVCAHVSMCICVDI